MDASPVDFIYILDGNYIRFLRLGIRALHKFHPSAKIFVYDVSPTPSAQIQELSTRSHTIVYTYWPEKNWLKVPWIDTLDFNYFHPNYRLKDKLKYLSRWLRFKLFKQMKETWIVDKQLYVNKRRRSVRIFAQKAICIQHCLGRTARNLIFLDADAVVWQPVADVFAKQFDVALTLRALNDIIIGRDPGVYCPEPVPYHGVNAGVICIRNNSAGAAFLSKWIEEIHKTRHFMIEQTALSQMVLHADPGAFDAYEKEITMADTPPIRLLLLPSLKFNNTYCGKDLSFDEKETWIAHFHGSLHQAEYFSAIERKVLDNIS